MVKCSCMPTPISLYVYRPCKKPVRLSPKSGKHTCGEGPYLLHSSPISLPTVCTQSCLVTHFLLHSAANCDHHTVTALLYSKGQLTLTSEFLCCIEFKSLNVSAVSECPPETPPLCCDWLISVSEVARVSVLAPRL